MASIRPNTQEQTRVKRSRQHISLKQRRYIVHAIADEGHIFKSASIRFNLPYSTVRSIHLDWERTGRYDTLRRGGDKRTRHADEHIEWIKARFLDDPDLSIPDLRDELNNRFRSNHPRLNLRWPADCLKGRQEQHCVRPMKAVEPNKGPNMSLVVAVDRTGLVAFKKTKVDKHMLTEHIRRSLHRTVTAAKVTGWMKEVKRHFLMALKGHPLGRLMNTKHAVTRLGYSQDHGQDPYPETDNEDGGEEEEEDDLLQTSPDVFESNSISGDDDDSSDTSESDTYEVDGYDNDLLRALVEEEKEDNQI
ncbi:hypothetical protein KI688_007941 [Linnemannia hyalina]|uniref:Uncharacterized protein n=1 Tax=Linnemannia hyalina TaxID=64524 RepID=A0A9P7XHC8_9FUNG|nr:hypothetical protein KI688_007941 [Linnemannia hyalina]